MSLKLDLVTLCEGAGVGTHNVNIFTTTKSSPPILASGAASLSIIETGGEKPERTNTTRVQGGTVQRVTTDAYRKPSAIFISRASTPAAAEAMARAAYDAVTGFRNGFINSGWYREISAVGDLIDNGMDGRGQARYTFNVIAIKRPS